MTLKPGCINLSNCAFKCFVISGWECPTFKVPMAPAKSMNTLPSTSLTVALCASSATCKFPFPTPRATYFHVAFYNIHISPT